MIPKINSGKSTAGLIRYLFDTKKAKDHTDPHLVASWDGCAPDPGRADDFDATKKLLVADLDLHVKQARRLNRAPEQHVWHCSIRAAKSDRHLSDEEWADIARRVVAATGIAPDGDPDGCRWVAVRHAPDHIHIAATKVRGDLSTARHWNDFINANRELAAVEKEYSLFRVARGDRTAAKRPTRAEQEKALRASHDKPARDRLRATIRTAVAAASSVEEFVHLLSHTDGVLVEIVHFPSGDVRGYKVASEDTTTADKEPVWFAGYDLAPDLSLPKIRKRLQTIDPQLTDRPGRRRPKPWHQVAAATECIPHHLDQTDDEASQAHLVAFGEALDALPLIAPQDLRPQLREAATAFERATRSRIQAEHHHARVLRGAVRAMLHEPAPKDGSALAMLLDAAILTVIATARWHQRHHHDQQVAAAHQTLLHLQAAYDWAAAVPLASLAQRRPPQPVMDRHIRHIRQAMSSHAQQVVEDPAFDALAVTLAEAEAAGYDPARLLQEAADQRALDDAASPARVLVWRIQRLTTVPTLSTLTGLASAPHTSYGTTLLSSPLPSAAGGQRRR
ncbi:relaxase/mobilization nuclease domain-containing protein [Streptomyces europaeiscabiei]|uniref:relaxase/mobilization nuclease domain-containing protein n=1 Tax=Streptomyces europaeiscabiei TaxID=146819 RepID=UPI0029A8BBD2|nr:mobilization protein [Streptomyces europaeiscabiei]MDX3611967.1 mobilization protein [Streptomyces europaeiscabiei]